MKKEESDDGPQQDEKRATSKFDSQAPYDLKIEPKKQDDDSSEDEQSKAYDEKMKQSEGLSIEDFKKLKIPNHVMRDGMIFIWVEKEYIYDIVTHLESQNFFYVENVCYVMIDKNMEKEVRNFATIDATPAFITEDYTYLKKCHKSLLMFRRTSSDGRLELRHQRTGDVVFNWKDFANPQRKPDFYLYRLIEILLPKAHIQEDPVRNTKKSYTNKIKLVELWA